MLLNLVCLVEFHLDCGVVESLLFSPFSSGVASLRTFLAHVEFHLSLCESPKKEAAAARVDEGELRPVNLPGENPRFELAGHQHHHHFQCTQCQRVFDVHACPGDLSRLAPQGFTVEDHDLTLYGRCKDCAPRSAAARAASPRTPHRHHR